MRFAITVTDRYLDVFQALLARAWKPVKVFTCKVDDRLHRNSTVIDFARSLNVDVQISPLTDANLRELADKGCEALVVASYDWRIGNWRPHLKYAVNFHPAPLPRGRGAYPLPAAILEQAASWGVTCHKVEPEFDSGDILKATEFPLSPHEDHDSLDLRIQLATRLLAADVADHFIEYWNAAIPQAGQGRYYPKWTETDRRLDFKRSVAEILRQIRAFGPLECLASINDALLFVQRAVGWTEPHQLIPGTVVHVNSLSIVVAVADGYIGLTQWTLINPDTVTGTFRR
jgi:methionyl-tRNA formyltransferase